MKTKRVYKQVDPNKAEKHIEIQFIPYFSWNNRGIIDMSVWMPMSY
ncbi:MAG: hypothetical protein SNH73_02575 [Rikenellaceae bacterium]